MRANYNIQNINKFIGDLRVGRSTVYDIPKVIPKIKKKKVKKQMKTEEL